MFCVWRDLMKMEYVLSQSDREQIEKYQKQIDEIKQEYIDEYLSRPFQDPNLEKRFRNDSRIQILEKAIVRIYTLSVGSYVITTETEEELKTLKDNWKLGERTNAAEEL